MKFADLPRKAADDEKREIDPAGVQFPVDFELRRPLDLAGKELKALSLREPTVADMERADEAGSTGHAKMIRLLADLSGHAPDDIRKLCTADYRDMSELVNAFL